MGDTNLNEGPVFVVGVWRSGTSLLHALLNQHPEIGLMYEAELPLLSSLFLGGRSKSDWPERWEFWNNALSRHGLDPAGIAPASTLRGGGASGETTRGFRVLRRNLPLDRRVRQGARVVNRQVLSSTRVAGPWTVFEA